MKIKLILEISSRIDRKLESNNFGSLDLVIYNWSPIICLIKSASSHPIQFDFKKITCAVFLILCTCDFLWFFLFKLLLQEFLLVSYPYSNHGETDYAHLITTGNPGFSDLLTALKCKNIALSKRNSPYCVVLSAHRVWILNLTSKYFQSVKITSFSKGGLMPILQFV